MTNAELFKATFNMYATEMWSKPEREFLTWLNDTADNKATANWMYDWGHYKCSECGYQAPEMLDGVTLKYNLSDNCPKCGRKMLNSSQVRKEV